MIYWPLVRWRLSRFYECKYLDYCIILVNFCTFKVNYYRYCYCIQTYYHRFCVCLNSLPADKGLKAVCVLGIYIYSVVLMIEDVSKAKAIDIDTA